jgi:hypothetical protein
MKIVSAKIEENKIWLFAVGCLLLAFIIEKLKNSPELGTKNQELRAKN